MSTTVTRLLTYEEWIQMPTVQDGIEEVVKGELRFMPPNRFVHGKVIQRIIAKLSPQVDDELVEIMGSNIGQLISRDPLTCRSPDLVVFWLEKMDLTDGLLCSPVDLIVEVVSPSETKRRRQEKLDDYESIGVPEVWMVFEKTRTVKVYLLINGKLVGHEVSEGDLRPVRFPGVSIPIASIWPK
jgi:Uma2 family endonuclease